MERGSRRDLHFSSTDSRSRSRSARSRSKSKSMSRSSRTGVGPTDRSRSRHSRESLPPDRSERRSERRHWGGGDQKTMPPPIYPSSSASACTVRTRVEGGRNNDAGDGDKRYSGDRRDGSSTRLYHGGQGGSNNRSARSNGGQASSSSSRISAAAPSSLKTKAVKELEEKYGKLLPTPSLLHLRHPYPGELDKSSQDLFFACEARINKIALRPGPVLGHYQEELFTEIRTPTDRDRLLPKLARKARKKKHLGLDVENTSTRDNSLNVLLLGFPGHELVGIRLRHFPSFEDAVGPDMAEVLRDSSVKKLGIGVEEDVKQLQKQGGLSVEGACDLRPFLRRSWEDGGFSAIQNPERKESVKFFLHVVCGADNTLFFRGSSRGKYASHLKYFGEEYNDSTLPPSRTLQNVLQFGRPARPGALVAPGGEGQDPRLGKWQRRYCAGDAMFPLLIVDREAQRRITDSPAKKMVEDSLLESILSDMEEAAAQEEEEAAEKTAAPGSKKRRGKDIEHLFSIAGYEKILEKRGEQTEEAEEIDWQKANQGGTMHKRIARERDDGDIEVISINVHEESRFEDEEEDISEGQAEERQKKEKRKSTESSSQDDEGPREEATKEPAEAD